MASCEIVPRGGLKRYRVWENPRTRQGTLPGCPCAQGTGRPGRSLPETLLRGRTLTPLKGAMCTPDVACPHTLLAELTKSPPSTRARRDLGSDGPGGTGRTERPDRRRVRQPGGLAGGFRGSRADRGRHRPPVASGTASPLPQLQPLLPRGRQAAASADRRRDVLEALGRCRVPRAWWWEFQRR